MVKGDKKKREYERKKTAEEDAKSQKRKEDYEKKKNKEKDARLERNETSTTLNQAPPSNFKGVREDAVKLITEANERFEATRGEDESTNHKWKRNITSNWTRYEIESDEEGDEDGLTGEDWNYAISSGTRSASHTKLKGEQDWDTSGSTGLSEEFFSLDIGALDSALQCIPLHIQLDIDQDALDADTIDMFRLKATENARLMATGITSSEDIAGKMMSILQNKTGNLTIDPQGTRDNSQVKKVEPEKALDSSVATNASSPVKVDVPHEELSGPPQQQQEHQQNLEHQQPAPQQQRQPAPQEQRQRRRRVKEDKVPEAAPDITESQPLEQRVRRKDRDPREPVSEQTANSSSPSLAAVSNPSLAAVSNPSLVGVSNPLLAAVSNPSAVVSNPSLGAVVSNSVHSSSFPASQVPIVTKLEEKKDLDFLESLEADAPAEGGNEDKARPGAAAVVPVQIIKEEEKKDLEDWLDDFLDD